MEVVLIVAIISLALILALQIWRSKSHPIDKIFYQKHWQRINSYLDDSNRYALAIIEADKLLDQAFKDYNFKGETMAERLAAAGDSLSQKDLVWKVHKLRNRLVHEMDVELNFKQTKITLSVFKRALEDLGVL